VAEWRSSCRMGQLGLGLLASFVSHHLLSILVAGLSLLLAATVLGQRRPPGSAFAWLLAIFLVPYAGIPLYLIFGGRKFQRRARSKNSLALPPGNLGADAGAAEKAPSHLLGDPRFFVRHADSIEWLDEGTLAYRAFLREIQGAKESIRLVTFVVGSDTTGRPLLEALAKRAEEGIEVRLLLDDLLRFHAPRELLARIVKAGGRVERFMPLLHLPFRGRSNLRNHRKIALFDGARAIVGGMNLATEYMGPEPDAKRWKDLSVLVSGEAVATLDLIFRADWQFACGERLSPCAQIVSNVNAAAVSNVVSKAPGPIPLIVVPSGPDAPTDPIYDAMATAIFRAEKRFWVATPYFVPDETLARALAVAARRGVDVRIIVPAHSNHGLADLAAGPYLRDLQEAGARVFRHSKMVHAKTMLADDSVGVVGSANFDMRSLFLDYEIALFLPGAREIARLGKWFEDTLAGAQEGAPTAGKLRAQVEDVARLLAPLI
jgi:cardiolipin synthase